MTGWLCSMNCSSRLTPSGENMSRKMCSDCVPTAKPVQLRLDLDTPKPPPVYDWVELSVRVPIEPESTLKPCHAPKVRFTQDQYKCSTCGVIWDVDETQPACEYPK